MWHFLIKPAFITPSGKYWYKAMPKGICNAPVVSSVSWIHCCAASSQNMPWPISILSAASHQCSENILNTFTILTHNRDPKLKLNHRDVLLQSKQYHTLVMFYNPKILPPTTVRLRLLRHFPHPKTKKRRVLFLVWWVSITYLSNTISSWPSPCTSPPKKTQNFEWLPDYEKAFQDLKKALLSSEVFAFPWLYSFSLAKHANRDLVLAWVKW